MCFVCRWSNDYNSEKHKSQLKHTYEIVKKKQVNLKEVSMRIFVQQMGNVDLRKISHDPSEQIQRYIFQKKV